MGEAEIGEEGEGLILPSQYYFHVLLFPQLDPPTRRPGRTALRYNKPNIMSCKGYNLHVEVYTNR